MHVDSTTVAFVTGGAGGIGGAIAAAVRALGATVITSDLTAAGADVALDITDLTATRAALDAVIADHGRLDLVVACAGMGVAGEVIDLDDAAWTRCLEVNLVGTVNTIRAGYERMVPAGRGHLVALSSLAGLLPTPLLVPYATAKGGIISLMTGLRPEAARHGIGVSVVCPGPVDTPLLDEGGAGGATVGVDVRRYLTSAAGPAITPSAVGAATLRAVERNRALVAPRRAAVLHLAARLNPGMTARIIARNMAKELAAG